MTDTANGEKTQARRPSQASENSQTAAEFINEQLRLEADAREALPYQFDTCTKPLGPLRQQLFSCLTCKPLPASPNDLYEPAGICYSCSISCHCEHDVIELFSKRNFVCDCGSTRLPATSPCTLRVDEQTGQKGVHSEEAAPDNKYNQNFRKRYCACGDIYEPEEEKGIMFQCLGLGTVEDGGCGEDWYHPECLIGLGREAYQKIVEEAKQQKKEDFKPKAANSELSKEEHNGENGLSTIPEETPVANQQGNAESAPRVEPQLGGEEEEEDEDPPLPEGFPNEDDFDTFLCFKCVNAFPWIRRYVGTRGFLPAVRHDGKGMASSADVPASGDGNAEVKAESPKKRKASEEPDGGENGTSESSKRQKADDSGFVAPDSNESSSLLPECKTHELPPMPQYEMSLFMKEDFRDHFCKDAACFLLLKPHPQLLEEEETYEPPVSEDGDAAGGSVGTGSLLDRGEAAFNNMDRVRAIEGAMVYAQLKDKVKTFLQPFAESGQAVGAEDIKSYFESLRGDSDAIKQAASGAQARGGNGDDDAGEDGSSSSRKEQSGY